MCCEQSPAQLAWKHAFFTYSELVISKLGESTVLDQYS
jgi:hypothetical protein